MTVHVQHIITNITVPNKTQYSQRKSMTNTFNKSFMTPGESPKTTSTTGSSYGKSLSYPTTNPHHDSYQLWTLPKVLPQTV